MDKRMRDPILADSSGLAILMSCKEGELSWDGGETEVEADYGKRYKSCTYEACPGLTWSREGLINDRTVCRIRFER